MEVKTKIILASSDRLLRDGLRLCLDDLVGFKVLSEFSTTKDLIQFLKANNVDILIVDPWEGDKLNKQFLQKIANTFPDLEVILMSERMEGKKIRDVLEFGVSGYVFKDCSLKELAEAIRKVKQGESYFSPQVTQIVMDSFSKQKRRTVENKGLTLTGREKQVLGLILNEYSNREIARELFISTRTVDTHKRHLLEKTGSKNVVGLLLYAYKNDLIVPY